MNKNYKALKKGLQDNHAVYFKLYRHHINTFPTENKIATKVWCYRVIDLLPIIKYSSLSQSNLEEAYSYYDQLLVCLSSTKPIKELERLIQSIEKLIIRCLATPLEIIEETFNQIYDNSVVQCENYRDKYSLISITLYYLIDPENSMLNFETLWEKSLKMLFKICFGIENNEFMKDYSKEVLFKSDFSEYKAVDKEQIHVLLDNIFQKSTRFKYFLKASKVFAQLKNFPVNEDQDMTTANMYIKILKIPSGAAGFQAKDYKISLNDNSDGHKSRYFTIGSSKLANIRLIKAIYHIESICFAIYYNGKNFLMIDCSKYNYSEVKMKPQVPYKIEKNYLIDLALTGILHIEKCKIKDNPDKDRNELELTYEYITGPLSLVQQGNLVQQGYIHHIVKTHKKEENADSIIFGRGGRGFYIDEFSDLLGLTGKQHICFFLNEDQEFCARDMETKNGSYLLLKTHQEAHDLKWSKVFPLFRNFRSFGPTENLDSEFYKERYVICQYIFEFEVEKV